MYRDIERKNGFYHIENGKITFMSREQLNLVKQIWRECSNWHPTDSLFTILKEIDPQEAKTAAKKLGITAAQIRKALAA